MSLLERLGRAPATTSVPLERCACRFPDRHYADAPCARDNSEVPLGPSGYCWSCWSARHDLPADTRPEWIKRGIGKDLTRA